MDAHQKASPKRNPETRARNREVSRQSAAIQGTGASGRRIAHSKGGKASARRRPERTADAGENQPRCGAFEAFIGSVPGGGLGESESRPRSPHASRETRSASSARYDERTNGPAKTWRNPRSSPASR